MDRLSTLTSIVHTVKPPKASGGLFFQPLINREYFEFFKQNCKYVDGYIVSNEYGGTLYVEIIEFVISTQWREFSTQFCL